MRQPHRADVIVPGGHHVHADAERNPELLWGCEGGRQFRRGPRSDVQSIRSYDRRAWARGLFTCRGAWPRLIGHYRKRRVTRTTIWIIAVNLLPSLDRGSLRLPSSARGLATPARVATTIESVLSYGVPLTLSRHELTYRAFHCHVRQKRLRRRTTQTNGNLDSSPPNSATTHQRARCAFFNSASSPVPSSRLRQIGRAEARIPESFSGLSPPRVGLSLPRHVDVARSWTDQSNVVDPRPWQRSKVHHRWYSIS